MAFGYRSPPAPEGEPSAQFYTGFTFVLIFLDSESLMQIKKNENMDSESKKNDLYLFGYK